MSAIAGAFALGGLQMGMDAVGQSSAIEQANEYNQAMWDAEVLNMSAEQTSRNFQQSQTEDQINQQKLAVTMQKLEKQGQARVSSAASGLTGRSINNLSQKFQEQAAKALATLSSDMDNSRTSYQIETNNSERATNSRIESQWKRPEFSWTSVISSGIQGGAQGASLGSSLKIGASNGSGSKGVK